MIPSATSNEAAVTLEEVDFNIRGLFYATNVPPGKSRNYNKRITLYKENIKMP
jgi:hypothetical protein